MITRTYDSIDDLIGAIRSADQLGLTFEARVVDGGKVLGLSCRRWVIEFEDGREAE